MCSIKFNINKRKINFVKPVRKDTPLRSKFRFFKMVPPVKKIFGKKFN